MSLKMARDALASNALAFKEIDAAAQEQIKESAIRAKLASEFGYTAAKAEQAANKRADAFAKEVAAAKRRIPCRTLLETDLEAVCGLSLH